MLILILLSFSVCVVWTQNTSITFLLFHDEGQRNFILWFEEGLKSLQEPSLILNVYPIELVKDNSAIYDKVCQGLHLGSNMAIDISWIGTEHAENVMKLVNVPYVKVDVTIGPFLELLDKYLDQRNATDVALLFDDTKLAEEALYYWINTEKTKLIIMDILDQTTAERLKSIRPIPNFYAIIGTAKSVSSLLKQAVNTELAKLIERWNLLLLDFSQIEPQELLPYKSLSLLQLDTSICCTLLKKPNCACPNDFILQKEFLINALKISIKTLRTLYEKEAYPPSFSCNSSMRRDDVLIKFTDALGFEVGQDENILERDGSLRLPVRGHFVVVADNALERIGSYEENNGVLWETGKSVAQIKQFYRIGITHAVPWAYEVVDAKTGLKRWTGFCVDFAAKLSEMMNFKYELVKPEKGTFGVRNKGGIWDGLVGDLQRGQTDLAIAALTMTADREEVIDFVAPYFDQSGISIVMRKPVRKTSLFKFMTVLKLEVWLSIVAALTITGFLIWCLDKYSPYSGQNNKEKFPYPCREFTLKESFWFALTSFTPQGGGEAPKSLSGRALVAAYWLFVVLMLATFTANLAAFLTVERMQTPVQSLDQLAKQSRINYTVVQDSDTHEYFINMKNAEDTLYRLWKELTLNASTDGTHYRVWDYPVREQYGHILLAINDSNPVENAEKGFRKVNDHVDADFAFIHDSAEIKYEISRNCNLTEVGEVFAEKPYAVAVQQGSHLTDTLSKQILTLQKDRFFDFLQSKYWNNSLKVDCSDSDDNEGITLESLGGVFIATLFGLALAMMTLAGEVIYYKRKKLKAKVVPKGKPIQHVKTISVNPGTDTITFGSTFKNRRNTNLRLSPAAAHGRLWDPVVISRNDKKGKI